MILSLLAVSFVAQEGGHGDGGHNAEMQFVQTLGRVIALGDAVAPGWREDDGKHRHRRGSCNPLTDLLLNSAISKPITALFQPNCKAYFGRVVASFDGGDRRRRRGVVEDAAGVVETLCNDKCEESVVSALNGLGSLTCTIDIVEIVDKMMSMAGSVLSDGIDLPDGACIPISDTVDCDLFGSSKESCSSSGCLWLPVSKIGTTAFKFLGTAISDLLCKQEAGEFCLPKLMTPLDAVKTELDSGASMDELSADTKKKVCDALGGPTSPCFGDVLSFDTSFANNPIFQQITSGGAFSNDALFGLCNWPQPTPVAPPAGGGGGAPPAPGTPPPPAKPSGKPGKSQLPGKDDGKKTTMIIAMSIGAVVLILSLGGFMVMRGKGNGSYTPVEMVDLNTAADDIADSDDDDMLDGNARDPPIGSLSATPAGDGRPLPAAFYE